MVPAPTKTVPDVFGFIWCILGTIASLYLARRISLSKWIAYPVAISLAVASFLAQEKYLPWVWRNNFGADAREWFQSLVAMWWLWAMAAAVGLLLVKPRRGVDEGRRQFFRTSLAAVCTGVPAVALTAGVITRKDTVINEIDIPFRGLPKDLEGLRLLQISDIHIGVFFSANDLRRVVDACNNLRADLVFITGDLITTWRDPLDSCIAELARLQSISGLWGCMGNHEYYAGIEQYAKRRAARHGIDFLREEARSLRFGSARLNLVGVDYRPWQHLSEADGLVEEGQFNLLLAHTPEIFPHAAKKGFDLTLAGHTHGGQINLDVLGTNFNVVDLHTRYTKGLYRLPSSTIYVNSGLGTIGLPVRIGAPPEITLIRLCNS